MRYRLDDALNKAVYGESCTPKVRMRVCVCVRGWAGQHVHARHGGF